MNDTCSYTAAVQTWSLLPLPLSDPEQLAGRRASIPPPDSLTLESPPPALLAHVHALRIIEPRTGTSILTINVVQIEASQPAKQAALLDLAG